jgi:hypothetical protein
MGANYINFVDQLIYGDSGAAELGIAAIPNHLTWTLANAPTGSASGSTFLLHHVDEMLSRYEQWRVKYGLPLVRPWDGSNAFPEPLAAPSGPSVPATLAGGPFPAMWTASDLGVAVRNHYATVRGSAEEMADEVKAPYSYRYWAFMKWASDLRRRLLGQIVLPTPLVFDRDGTILSEKDWMDYFNQCHHVWHPGGDVGSEPSWTVPTPGFKSSVGQFRGKKKITRAQIGDEFFVFHRDQLEVLDRWLARTGQDPVQSLNCCGHDSSTPTAPAPLNVQTGAEGLPKVDFSATPPTVNFVVQHTSLWEGTRVGFDGSLREFSSVGEMGQFIATDFQTGSLFTPPAIAGTGGVADSSYHAEGHVLNGDLAPPEHNNYSPRFFGWHGFLDEMWAKREPRFVTLEPVLADGVTSFPAPRMMTIVRDFGTTTDAVEPANPVELLDLNTGVGVFRCRFKVQDPFGRPLRMTLRCQVLREAVTATPVIELPLRVLSIVPGAPAGAAERQQNTDFVEAFAFDGTAGTVDTDGQGPFASANTLFTPPATGFKNSLLRVVATVISERRTDGTLPTSAGTVTSAGSTVIGSGTAFLTLFRNGDIIRVGDQTRTVWSVDSATQLTLSAAFAPDIASATPYAWAEGFEHERRIEIPLVQEKQAPDITLYLDHSSFSKDEVDANASGQFDNAFYVLVQDRSARPAEIVWPSDPKTDVILPQLKGLIAPAVPTAGLYLDLAHAPTVELLELSNAAVPGLSVQVTGALPEDPSLHPSVLQRITYTCRVVFGGNGMFAGMVAGDTRLLKLRVTARDRCGNTIVDDSARVRLQVNANPYMNDGPTSWLSVDTRVFRITQGQARFGVPAGWSDPNAFIGTVIDNFRAGGGTAGGESFDSLPEDQATSVLEYSTQVGGQNVYNFALAKVRLRSVTGATGVRCTFRLFRWGTANVSFDSTLAYRSAASGIGLLGVTTSGELASIPFFAEPRKPLTDPMTAQDDPINLVDFVATGGVEVPDFFGAYLDINQSTLRLPSTFVGDGPFDAVPAAQMRSVRDLLISHHQCMVCEVVYAPDPTEAGATPGTSDNLSQRNLLIVQTANPGSASTRQVQHSFDIDLTRRRRRAPKQRAKPHGDVTHVHGERDEQHERLPEPVPALARPARLAMAHGDGHAGHGGHGGLEMRLVHLKDSWLRHDPELLERAVAQAEHNERNEVRWQFHESDWQRLDGLDELAFFWNGLPSAAIVELYLPGCNVEEIVNYRNLRHAPGTVRIAGEQTLRLSVGGPVYLPIPAVFGDNLSGLVTVTLPPGIKHGQRFRIDVLQLRSDEEQVLGGFQVHIQVGAAKDLFEPEKRTLELFHQRLGLTPAASRWRPILERQVAFVRERARGLLELADVPGLEWVDPTQQQKGQRLRVVLERVQILDDLDPFIKGAGEFRFRARVHTRDNGGLSSELRLPQHGHYSISDTPGHNTVHLGVVLFEGFVEDHLAIELAGIEIDTFDPDDKLCPYRRVFEGPPERCLGSYGPRDEKIDPEDMGGWRLWYRIERA